MRCSFASLFALIVVGISLHADGPKPIELTIQASAIETPILKYRLYPAESEIKPGNAVPILLRLPWEQTAWMSKVFFTLHEWESRPLNDPKWESSDGVLPLNFYNEMKRAAFRRNAEWEYPIGETQTPYLILLPDLQGLKGFLTHGLSARIRYHLSRGELDKAREGILVGLANGRHLSSTPFYVCQLVALAVETSMLDRVGDLLSQPDSPNLYWALSTLPDGLLGFERAASLEGELFSQTFPAINDLDRRRDPKELMTMARQLVEYLELCGEIPPQPNPAKEESGVQKLIKRLLPAEKTPLTMVVEQARMDLPELLKISEKNVAAMSDEEVSMRWWAHLRITRDQHAAATISLPPREAWPELKKVQEEIDSIKEKTGSKGPDFLNPVSIYVSSRKLKRQIQSLRIIEAVRNHLATHDGKLPQSLDEITEVSIPIDPLTDLPFVWKVDGQMATLTAPSLPVDIVDPNGEIAKNNFLEYRLRVK